jgi:hypothetical protein
VTAVREQCGPVQRAPASAHNNLIVSASAGFGLTKIAAIRRLHAARRNASISACAALVRGRGAPFRRAAVALQCRAWAGDGPRQARPLARVLGLLQAAST